MQVQEYPSFSIGFLFISIYVLNLFLNNIAYFMSGYEFIITYYIQTKSTNSNHDEFKDSTVVFYIQVQPLLSKYDVEKTGKIQ